MASFPNDFSSFYTPFTFSDAPVTYPPSAPSYTESAVDDSKFEDSKFDDFKKDDPELRAVIDESLKTASRPLISRIEKITLFLISKMLTLADGMKRTDVTNVIEFNEDKEDDQDLDLAAQAKSFPGKSFSIGPTALTRSFRESETDTHFDGQDNDNTHIHPLRMARDTFSTLAKMFLGRDSFNRIRNIVEQRLPLVAKLFWGQKAGKENLQTLVQQQKEFDRHDRLWKSTRFSWNRESDFQSKMDSVFRAAKSLLAKKEEDEKEAYKYRIAFYATLAFSVIGKIMGQRAVSILGLGGFAYTFFRLHQLYGWNCQEAALLETYTTEAYSAITSSQKK